MLCAQKVFPGFLRGEECCRTTHNLTRNMACNAELSGKTDDIGHCVVRLRLGSGARAPRAIDRKQSDRLQKPQFVRRVGPGVDPPLSGAQQGIRKRNCFTCLPPVGRYLPSIQAAFPQGHPAHESASQHSQAKMSRRV